MENKLIDPAMLACVELLYNFYQIDMPTELKQIIDDFRKLPCLEKQRELTLILLRSLYSLRQHDSLCTIFEPMIKIIEKQMYDLQFDKDVENHCLK